ncbi:MAG: ATP-binding protein [Bacteroidota bacterium]
MPINKFSITSEYHNISIVNKKIKAFCLKEHLQTNIMDSIEICLMEALNNVIKHSYKGRPGNKIDILVGITTNSIEIDIMETGLPRTNFKKPTLEFNHDDLNSAPEGGMGLYIIDSLMDSTSYSSQNGLNITSFSKNLND